jgi:hypothetical protein
VSSHFDIHQNLASDFPWKTIDHDSSAEKPQVLALGLLSTLARMGTATKIKLRYALDWKRLKAKRGIIVRKRCR